ncbi:FAS1-like dehydratase domain-containing protein [Pontibacillus marinus]|uniref:FAS1-like dehydratase domain-containing protein n=2 Tax=Pontibacillus marinus TaxID=273164 RepID=UPI000404E826|nr:MaoC family dehydratase N-terminal domain-containing protein [Pontibacillus marinus]
MMEKWKCAQTDWIPITITRDEVRRFAKGIMEEDLIYFDEEKAREQGFEDLPLPVTMPVTFWRYFSIPWLEKVNEPLIHGKQGFEYQQPLICNHTYQGQLILNDVYEKSGSKGTMIFLEHTLNLYFQNELHAQVFTTLILFKKEGAS